MNDKFVTLTWSFIRDKKTTMQEKLILAEIQNLSMLDMGCIANNEHFSGLLGIKKESVSRSINDLVKKGYISIKISNGSRNFNRLITINKLLFDPKQFVISPLTNCLETKENISINKTSRGKTPTLEEVKAYISEKNLNVDAEHFYEYFSEGDWYDSKGNKVKNWKQKALTWHKASGAEKKEQNEDDWSRYNG